MWPCLVEKAFSKFCTNYAATEAGFPVFGDQMEGQRYPGAEGWEGDGTELSANKLWVALLAYNDMNFPMCCSIGSEREEMQGLIAGHAYSLLAVRKVICGSGRALKMCKIRNPHGETEEAFVRRLSRQGTSKVQRHITHEGVITDGNGKVIGNDALGGCLC